VIAAVVRQCRDDLAGSPPGALPELVERLARQRLTDLSPSTNTAPAEHLHIAEAEAPPTGDPRTKHTSPAAAHPVTAVAHVDLRQRNSGPRR